MTTQKPLFISPILKSCSWQTAFYSGLGQINPTWICKDYLEKWFPEIKEHHFIEIRMYKQRIKNSIKIKLAKTNFYYPLKVDGVIHNSYVRLYRAITNIMDEHNIKILYLQFWYWNEEE